LGFLSKKGIWVSQIQKVWADEVHTFPLVQNQDVGLLNYLATSDGFVEKERKFFKGMHRRLKVLQRRLSKKVKRSKNYEKARRRVEKQHNHIAFKRRDYQFKLAHKLCDMADSIFSTNIDFRIMAKGFLGKHTIDAAFGQFRSILKYVGWMRGKFVAEVDNKGSSQICPNCRIEVLKDLGNRIHFCLECHYKTDTSVSKSSCCWRVIRSDRVDLKANKVANLFPRIEYTDTCFLGSM